MPELPEVETIRRGLGAFILNKKIVRVRVLCQKSFVCSDNARTFFECDLEFENAPPSGAAFSNSKSGLTNALKKRSCIVCPRIRALRRFGKALVIDLDIGFSLIIHLRMTGQLIWRGAENYAAGHPSENFVAELPNRQTRVIFEFEDGMLYFNDQRKFGFVKVIKTEDVEKDDFIRRLAREPWDMTGEEFFEKCQRHANSLIKALILDQTVICGLGNIYADESLFYAGVHPARRAGSLSRKEALKILEGARKVMQESIDSGGSTMATYVKADGTRGDYLEKFAQVFRREGQDCPKCGGKIVKIRVAGRGTHICPKCQRREV